MKLAKFVHAPLNVSFLQTEVVNLLFLEAVVRRCSE